MPPDVIVDSRRLGPDWRESQVRGTRALIEKHDLPLPENIEPHDLSEAADCLSWRPAIGFLDFLRDLKARDARGEDVAPLHVPGTLFEASS